MTVTHASIGEYVAVRSHPNVVRLQDLDSECADWLSESFLLTPEVKNHLRVLTRLLEQKTGTGIFLIGHYGSGKSHFLAYLSQQLRSEALFSQPPDTLPLSLVNFSAANRLEDIISNALEITVPDGDRRPVWDTMLAKHPRGLLLVVDELSEFLRAKTDAHAFTEDVRFLQFIGEWTQDRPCWIIAALQEGIEHTGELEYDLYRKIKDRYPYRLLLSPAHVKALIADSILIKKPGYEAAVENLIRELGESYPPSALDFDTLRAIYPLHPNTLELLQEVRDRFSQARGIVDFTVTRLCGDPARDVPGFIDRPFGDLLTPDIIVDHFRDLFELQPEFLPLAQKVFPWYQKHFQELFERSAMRTLAERLLKLLVLAHLSPGRERISAQEAATWLLFSVTRVEPERNRKIIERLLSTLAERGRYVSVEAGRYQLDLRDDGGAALERMLQREISALKGQWAVILETLIPLLPAGAFNPFVLPRDQWQHRQVSWHFHKRQYAVWLGHRRPEPVEGIALCLRLPWGEGEPMPRSFTLQPAAIKVTADLVELAALTRLRERPGNPDLHERIRQRIDARAHIFVQVVRSAWQESRLITPEGKAEPAPRLEAKTTLDSWLEFIVLWLLRRRFPAFERFAPRHGPLPREAWLRFMRFATVHDLGSAEADDYVKLIREAYLVPMALLRRKGREYQIPASLDRHELVRLIGPLLEHNPSPKTVHEHLSEPIYGLVPDQSNLLLIFLLLQGEIDILKGRSSYRESFETLPNPLHYDRLVPGHALGMERLNELQRLCEGLNIRIPSQWSVMMQRRCASKLVELRGQQRNRLQPLIGQLRKLEQGRALADRMQRHLDLWNALDKGEHPLQGLEQFLFEITPVDVFLEELKGYERLPERLQRLLSETRRYVHLLQHPGLGKLLPELDTLRGEEIPTLDEPELMEDWLRRASGAYEQYKRLYRQRHELWWKEVFGHPIWGWRSPSLARSRHINLAEVTDEIERCRQQASKARCLGLANLDYQAQCSCGFDGETAPIEPLLERFDGLKETVETRLRLFFQQDEIKSRLRDWQREGVEMHTDTISYLEGRRAVPRIRDIESLDHYLSGVELATEMDTAPVLELLCQRLWQPAELLQALERLLDSNGKRRLRFTGGRGGDIPDSLVEWCARQSLSFGVSLPEGLQRKILAAISQVLRAEWVSPEALFRLEELGLDQEGVRRVLGWLVDGHVPLPDPVPENSLLDAVGDILRPPVVRSPGQLADISERLYRFHDLLRYVVGERWLDLLEAVANTPLDGQPELPEVLYQHRGAQWLLIDAMGLPLSKPMQSVLSKLFAEWGAIETEFAQASTITTTEACYRSLLDAGITHPFEKTIVIDELLHKGLLPFDDIISLAETQLTIACKHLKHLFDPQHALLIFADHGFRISSKGSSYSHGGSSTLERVVPVWYLPAKGLGNK